MTSQYDLTVIGAGIVGLSAAYQIQQEYPDMKIAVLEKEDEVAFHQTGHNSGVIHSGIYYKPGSEKALNCKLGRQLLIEFAREHEIPFDICGKIISATHHSELPLLYKIYERGLQNEIEGIKVIQLPEILELEPNASAMQAIHVPAAGIINYKTVSRKLKELLQGKGVTFRFGSPVKEIKQGKEIEIKTSKESLSTKYLVACAGLFSDKICKISGLKTNHKIVGFRGDYYKLTDEAKGLVKNLIYPVPDPKFPFLGVHLTRMIDDEVECGPNAVFSFKREGYEKTDFDLNDSLDSLAYPGTWKLFFKHWKQGLEEYKRAFSKRLFLESLQRLVPSLQENHIKPARAGVRAVALTKKGEIIDDFKFEIGENMVHVINAPSPAATACLAIGQKIRNKLAEMF